MERPGRVRAISHDKFGCERALGTSRAEPVEPDKTPHPAGRDPGSLFAGNEACIVELPDGRLLMNTRGSARGTVSKRGLSISDDGGATWAPLRHDAALVEPSCHADLLLAK